VFYISFNIKQLFRFLCQLRESLFFYLIFPVLLSIQANKLIADVVEKFSFENAITVGFLSLFMLTVYISIYKALHFDYDFIKSIMPTNDAKRFKIIKVGLANVYWLVFLGLQTFYYKQQLELLYFPILAVVGLVLGELFYRIDSKPYRKSVLSKPNSFLNNIFIFESLLTRKIRNLSWYAFFLYLAVLAIPCLIVLIILTNLSYTYSSSYILFSLIFYLLLFHGILFQKDRPDHQLIRGINNRFKHIVAHSESNVFVSLIVMLTSIHIVVAYITSDVIDLRREFLTLGIFVIISKILLYKAAYFRELSVGRISLRIMLYLLIFLPLVFFV